MKISNKNIKKADPLNPKAFRIPNDVNMNEMECITHITRSDEVCTRFTFMTKATDNFTFFFHRIDGNLMWFVFQSSDLYLFEKA
jgi:hypothetical protein